MADTCEHKRTFRGPDVSRRYGSWQSWVCVVCGQWRTTDHHGKQPGRWRPFSELAEASEPYEEM